ncbi:MAG: glycoside hydrolase family 127 protein [Anaerolineae bacterium]|nr:glycoside hydrolase family 127 protein [Anaerolineae bacterium]
MLHAIALADVRLLDGEFQRRYALNRAYVMRLRNEALLQNYLFEAGLHPHRGILRATSHGDPDAGDDWHWGWESPTCQLRGHFLGHWLSAAARMYASTGDGEAKAKADAIVADLARCQARNGGEWAGSIPEKYFAWIAQGHRVWAPHYTIHKTLMGLVDMAKYAGNQQALEILVRQARWFTRWTAQFSRKEMDDILDVETGGMLEAWSDLYGITGDPEHLELMRRYDRPRLFERLLSGDDPLTNRHANTTIPEAHGAARAYEVTGEERYRAIAEAYWRCAVTNRGTFATGGQTNGEIWTPPFEFASRLGDKTQEHCTVYNMMRLADYLYRWTGDVAYADYIERNLYNGILAQQNRETGMIAYFLPLEPGAQKIWGSPTSDFWCCHGSLVQAHTYHNAYVAHDDDAGLIVNQYIPTELTWTWAGVPVVVRQTFDAQASGPGPATLDGALRRPDHWTVEVAVVSEAPVTFALKLRLPWWLADEARLWVNGEPMPVTGGPSSYAEIHRTWHRDIVRVELPKSLTTCPLPDEPQRMAFMDGPVVLAGLCDEERALLGDPADLTTILAPHNEREWGNWLLGYRTINQDRNLLFKPLHEIVDERYTVYFPVRRR